MSRKGSTATYRLKQDYLNLKKDPVPYIEAEPLPEDILEWHYVIKGPENSPYHNGYYHGTLMFTPQYPFKPPSIYMRTPNGRFQINRRLCLSISDFHPDQWNPSWSVSTILTGLLSFMLEESQALGSIEYTRLERIRLAEQSLLYNLNDKIFSELFPDICNEMKLKLNNKKITESNNNNINNNNNNKKNGGNIDNNTNDNKLNHISEANNIDLAQNNDINLTINNQNSLRSNVILGICFCLFSLIVRYIYNNLS